MAQIEEKWDLQVGADLCQASLSHRSRRGRRLWRSLGHCRRGSCHRHCRHWRQQQQIIFLGLGSLCGGGSFGRGRFGRGHFSSFVSSSFSSDKFWHQHLWLRLWCPPTILPSPKGVHWPKRMKLQWVIILRHCVQLDSLIAHSLGPRSSVAFRTRQPFTAIQYFRKSWDASLFSFKLEEIVVEGST